MASSNSMQQLVLPAATERSVPTANITSVNRNKVTFKLRWPSGGLIGEFTAVSVERFVQDLEEGLVEGVIRCRSRNDADYDEPTIVGRYRLFWGSIEMEDGEWFSDHDMPDGAELTLVHDRRAHTGALPGSD